MSAKLPKRATRKTAPPESGAPKRLSPEARKRQIVEGAITFFAETGFDGGTRQLAERLGITQPLLYRYFPTKQDLIREVYEALFVGRWRDQWADIIGDRGRPLRDRLVAFYMRYTEVISDPQWIRIYLFAGLKGLEINRWWSRFVDQNILTRICAEIRHEERLPGLDTLPLTAEESEAFWVLHGGIFYHGVRQDVYGMKPQVSRAVFAALAVDALMASLPAAARQATGRRKKKPG
jgi:AcrR family transcriptional regulator